MLSDCDRGGYVINEIVYVSVSVYVFVSVCVCGGMRREG